jgi:hypothetical protein
MKKSEPIDGPVTLDSALEHFRKRRPDLLLLLIADAMGPEVANALAGELQHLKRPRGATFLPREADAIREDYKHRLKLNPTKKASDVQDEIAQSLGISYDLLTDIIGRKKSYARGK